MSLNDLYTQYTSGPGGATKGTPIPWRSGDQGGVLAATAASAPIDVAASSQERGAPERLDANAMVGFQIAEAAGRAPGFVYERPLAIADTIAKQATGQSPIANIENFVGGIPFLGDLLGGGQTYFEKKTMVRRALSVIYMV